MAKTHWRDAHGPICGALQVQTVINGPKDLREVSRQQLSAVTCLRCVKKLREWGFAIQSFSEAVRNAVR